MGLVSKMITLAFPKGRLWKFIGDAQKLIDGSAIQFQSAKDLTDTIILESNPATAVATLPEWHAALGVHYDPTLSISKQQKMLSSIKTATGSSTKNGLAYQIAKEYPGLTIVEYNVNPGYPDDPAGVTYLQDAWMTVDGWTNWVGSGVVSTVGGALRSAQGDQAFTAARKSISTSAEITVAIRVRASIITGTFSLQYFNGGYITFASLPSLDTSWKIIIAKIPSISSFILLRTNSALPAGQYFEVDWIYIGTGKYLPNYYSISGTVDTVQDARRVGAILAHFAPLHLVPTVFGYTAPTAGNPNPVPSNPTGSEILSSQALARVGIAACGLARCGKVS